MFLDVHYSDMHYSPKTNLPKQQRVLVARPEANISCLLQLLPMLYFRVSPETHGSGILLSPPPHCLYTLLCPAFYMVAGGPDSGPHAYIVSVY